MSLVNFNAVEIVGEVVPSPVLFVCEHASRAFPEHFGTLGLSEDVLRSHVAWDPGALTLAKSLAAGFDAPVVAGTVSRLLYDCNRAPEAVDAMPTRSEIFDIPGNNDLTDAARAERIEQIYQPFIEAVAQSIDTVQPSAIVTVHSFTPIYHGQERPVEIGVLHDSDSRLADGLLEALEGCGYTCRRNDPYGPEHGVTHSLKHHAQSRGLLNVMLEVRNDLLADPVRAGDIAAVISGALRQALRAEGVTLTQGETG